MAVRGERQVAAVDPRGLAEAEVEAELAHAEELLRSTRARSYEPMILEERARLSAALNDRGTAATLRGEALDLYRELERRGTRSSWHGSWGNRKPGS
jgi:hypothetical protein